MILVDTNVLYALADRGQASRTPHGVAPAHDLRLGGTDASIAAICERFGIVTVATVNMRDFAIVRPRHIPAFITVPGLN